MMRIWMAPLVAALASLQLPVVAFAQEQSALERGLDQFDAGNLAAASASFRQSVSDTRAYLAKIDANDDDAKRVLLSSLMFYGKAEHQLGNFATAEPTLREALKLARDLAARHPADSNDQRGVSSMLLNLGEMQIDQGRDVEARSTFEEGLAFARARLARTPRDYRASVDLVDVLVHLNAITADRNYISEALSIVEGLQKAGALAEDDVWMLEDLRQRLLE